MPKSTPTTYCSPPRFWAWTSVPVLGLDSVPVLGLDSVPVLGPVLSLAPIASANAHHVPS